MMAIIAVTLLLTAAVGTVVAFTRDPARQAVTLSVYGLTLTLLFLELRAPDVALSQLAVGTAVVPLVVMLAVRKIARVRTGGGRARQAGERTERRPR